MIFHRLDHVGGSVEVGRIPFYSLNLTLRTFPEVPLSL